VTAGTNLVHYTPQLYVARKGARQWLSSRLNKWKARPRQAQTISGDQALAITGERGSGKTWFLCHLAKDNPEVSPVAAYLDLQDRSNYSTPGEYVRAAESAIQQQVDGQAEEIILLLDSVPHEMDEYLRELEDNVLRPYLKHRHTLIVMALVRPVQICWRVTALYECETYQLPPFNLKQTKKQLRKLHRASLIVGGFDASSILRDSGGLPFLNYLLVTHNRQDAFRILLRHWFLSIPPADRPRVRQYLEAIWSLDSLEDVSIEKALEVYRRHSGISPVLAWGVRNLLLKHWLARSSPESPAHITLLPGVRSAIQEEVRTQAPALYTELEEMVREKRERHGQSLKKSETGCLGGALATIWRILRGG
jgi:hypothetical protein